MAALWNRAGHYIFVLWFLLSSIYLFSSPIFSRRRLDIYHTSTHGVALVQIQDAVLKRAARCRLKIQDVRIDNRKKNLLNTNVSPTCPHNTVNFDPLTAEICLRVWGTPANFNGFRVLAALLNGTPILGVSQTLRR